ncbi:DegT/DnrJ/EryC1/StrS family aminotransferase [Sandaracinus amylolyticus]|uniref:DegT/DnrJ/EryC1/StrS family aminotransferase n=1 Tax=Sandaracinus amylolyticus TaxID=927083 RepID=UPI002E37A3AF|nr:DegT/DnrJ/EryC1/StrS family aminotransferase [Sandaracinus amylolyticus]UJR86726.1 Hypothetical protein I5071_88270 [Sandaracinus amylolyticus]
MAAYIHPTAIVDDGAELGDGTKVWHFVHVSTAARIGARCSLGQNVFVGRGVRIGNGVKIQNNVSVYEGVEIADDVFLGPSCVFTNVNEPRAFVERKSEYRATKVSRGASIGANATIVCGHTIGEYAFVAAGAVVTNDVPAYALVAGVPARRMGWVSRLGRRLRGEGVVTCPESGERYRIEGERCVPLTSEENDTSPIPLLDLTAQNGPLLPEIRVAMDRVIAKNAFILGAEVEQFEKEVAKHIGVAHALGVSSGTDALLLALMALDVGQGDEVVTTPYSFFATAGCVARLGAKPVFVDVDPRTMNMDVAQARAAITPRTKAILPVHLFGQPCDPEALAALGRETNIPIIEDAAQAIGATTKLGPVGGLGAVGCFSFFPSKNLGAFGDAGLVTTNDAALAEKMKRLRAHGAHPKYFHALIGGNFRLDAIQAAVLRVKLPHLSGWTEGRRANAGLYDRLFAEAGLPSAALRTPARVESGHIYNQYVIRTAHRDALKKHLGESGIATEIYYPRPLHLQECFAYLGHAKGAFPESERAADDSLALPVYGELGESRVRRIARTVIDFLKGRG